MSTQTLLVPAYIYPTLAGWTQYVNGVPTVAVMIANASNGPGSSVNSDYTTGITNARAAGSKVIGYVDTNYTSRTLTAVEADIDSWYSFYTIDGLMFDRVQADSGHLSYYTSLYNYVKSKNTTRNFVALNPGTTPAESYMAISDTCSIFENSYTAWQSASPYASWMSKYAPGKLWVLVYSIPDTNSLQAVVKQTSGNNIGRLFTTDQTGYTTAPSTTFWNTTLTDLQQGVIMSNTQTWDSPDVIQNETGNTKAIVAYLASPSTGKVIEPATSTAQSSDLAASGTITATTQTVQLQLGSGQSTWEAQFTGTFTASTTFVFEGTDDPSSPTNWDAAVGYDTSLTSPSPITSIVGNGTVPVIIRGNASGYQYIRVRCTVFHAGDSVSVRLVASTGANANAGSAVNMPDGANVTQGSTTDTAVVGDNTGTLSAKLRGLTKILNDIWDSVNHLFHFNLKQVGGNNIAVGSNAVPILNSAATGYVSAYGSNAANTTGGADYSFKWGASGTTQVNHVMIQNNTAPNISWDLDTATNAGSPILATGQTLFLDVQTSTLHLQSSANQNVNGSSANNIVVRGWL